MASAPALGARHGPAGLDVMVRGPALSALELCLPDLGGRERRVPMTRDGALWHGHVAGATPGCRYGLRTPDHPGCLLLDPYAVAVDGDWCVAVGEPTGPRPVSLHRPLAETVIYEAHVRGLTRLHPAIPPGLRGTYAALGHPALIAELRSLGVTALELLPVAAFRTETSIAAHGRANYWGYSPVAFLAPHAPYAAGSAAGAPAELRTAITALHDAGIEVILDVVYNHTGEGGDDDQPVSLRGLEPGLFRAHDVTGTGNSLDASHPALQRLVLDALRHWATWYGIDGFRFDLAVTLGRGEHGFDAAHPLLAAIADDPVLAPLKLIAEPWDIGPDGYRVGGFAPPWSEWNGRYRDAVREFWRGRDPTSELAKAVAGSSETFAPSGRGPLASVNLVTSHDGFTLRDLVSYDGKHNLANGESNRDGDDHNRSWNSGAEGPTDDPAIEDLRDRRAAAILATMAVSAGVPMLTAGDERGRTQRGNNNTYCHDSPLTWVAWDETPLTSLVRRLLALRAAEPLLRRERHFTGSDGDVTWLTADGRQLDGGWWQDSGVRTLGMLLESELLLIFHAGDEAVAFALPTDETYSVVIDSASDERVEDAAGTVCAAAWSVLILRARQD